MAISQVELPNNTTEDIHDVRITGVDNTPTSGSTNVVTSGGIYTALQAVYSLIGDIESVLNAIIVGQDQIPAQQ